MLQIRAMNHPPITAFSIGSVRDTLAGRIDDRLRERWFRAADYSYGFEAGSPKGLSSIGEAVIVGGLCYTSSTEEGPDYGKVIVGEKFLTGGMFLLPKEARPTHQLSFQAPIRHANFCQEVYRQIGRPVVFLGLCHSPTLYTMEIGRPPIHGKPIFENKEYYFPRPHQTLRNVPTFVIGVVASYSDARWTHLHQQLEAVLYHNPFDSQSLSTHTHGLLLKSGGQITSQNVAACLHIFSDQTTLSQGNFFLYTLESIIQKYD